MADATPEPRVSDVDWATHIVVTKRQWTEVHATIASQAEALAAKEAEVEQLRGVSYGMDDDTDLVLENWREAAMNAAADGDEKTWVEPLALLSLLANVRGLFARVSIAEAALKAAREALAYVADGLDEQFVNRLADHSIVRVELHAENARKIFTLTKES